MVLHCGWHLRKDRLPGSGDFGIKLSVASRAAQVDGHGVVLAAARAAGSAVTNTPGAVTAATADIALTLILMTARRAGASMPS